MQYTLHGYPYPLDTDGVADLRNAQELTAKRREKDSPQPTTTFTYDASNRVSTVTERLGDNSIVRTTTFTYDASTGLMTSSVEVLDGRTETTTFTYSNGLLTSAAVVIS